MVGEVVDSKSDGGHVTSSVPSHVGAFPDKTDIISLLKKYVKALAMITLVHDRGARKYFNYSWLIDPNASNSSIEDNLNALYRHFVAHSMGQIVDSEGLPHIFHMACRAGMLVSTYYRQFNPFKVSYKNINDTDYMDHSFIGRQITPEEIACIAGESQHPDIPHDLEQLQPYIQGLMLEMSTNIDKFHKVYPGTIHPLDHLDGAIVALFIAVLRYTQLELEGRSWDFLLDRKNYTTEDLTYMADQFGINVMK